MPERLDDTNRTMSGAPRRPLRVLALATTFPAVGGDGTPEFVLTLSNALVRAGLDVTVLVPRVAGGAATETIDGLRVRRFAYFPRRWEGLADGAIMANLRAERRRILEVGPLVAAFESAAWRETARSRPDVVHAHWVVPAGLVAWSLRRRFSVPYVVTAHGADAYVLNGTAPAAVKRRVLAGAAATVPVSQDIGAALGRLGPVHEPIPMGVDVEAIRAEVGPRRPEPGRILFVGRLVEKKGVDVLLQALARVPAASLVVVGDGPSRADLQALAGKVGVADRVTFRGQQPRREVLAELGRAALVAIPSQVGAGGDQDGTPVVLGEAMAAGAPVVVSDLGGLAENISDGDTGWVVPAGSVDALVAALTQAVADPAEASRRADRAGQALFGRLDLDSVGARYRDVLAAAAATASAPSRR